MQAWELKLCKRGGEPGWDRSCLQPDFTGGEEEEKGERTVSLLSLSLRDTSFPSPALNLSQHLSEREALQKQLRCLPRPETAPAPPPLQGDFKSSCKVRTFFPSAEEECFCLAKLKINV